MNMGQFNEQILIFAGTDDEVSKKKKKSTSLSSILKLTEALANFSSQIEDVVEPIDDEEAKAKLGEFVTHVQAMYDSLVELIKAGIKSAKQEETDIDSVAKEVTKDSPKSVSPSILTTPNIPLLPR